MIDALWIPPVRLCLTVAAVICVCGAAVAGAAIEEDAGTPLEAAAEIAIAGVAAGDEAVDEMAEEIQEAKPTLLQLAARLGGDWFASLVDKPVNHKASVDRVVMGNRARGTAATTGRVTMRQLDGESSKERVVFLLTLTGRTASTTRSSQGPVQVRCRTTMPFRCDARVFFDGTRFTAEAASYEGTVQMRVDSIRVDAPLGRGLIRQIARRRVEETRGCAERIALARTRTRVTEAFDQNVAKHLVRLNQRIANMDLGEMFKKAVEEGELPAADDLAASAPSSETSSGETRTTASGGSSQVE